MLSKMSDGVSNVWSASAKSQRGLKEFKEVYIDKRSIFIIIYKLGRLSLSCHSVAD